MPSIRDFSGGVVNQELQNRDAGNGVLFDCKNVLSSWNGELRKRTGTRLLKELGGNVKVIPYRLPDGDDMIMILKDKVINCYVFDDDGNLIPYVTTTGGGEISFPSGDTWHTGASNTSGNWTVNSNCMTPSLSYNMFYSVGTLPYNTGVQFYRAAMLSPGQFIYIGNTGDVVFSSCKVTWLTTDSYNHNFVWRAATDPVIQYSDDGINWVPIQTDVSAPELTSEDFPGGIGIGSTTKTWYKYTISNNSYLTAHKYWRIVFNSVYKNGDFHSAAEPDPSALNWAGTRLLVENTKFKSVSTETNLVFNNCPYENDDFDYIRWSQNNRTITMACKSRPPYQITISGGSFSDSLFVPSDYSTLWQTIGYPSCVTYYQNRLWFGGFGAAPTRVYASEFGKFDKFAIPSPIVSTSPIMADGTEIYNIIENMWGGNNALYCLSEDGISMIDAQGAIVATDQVEFKLRNREPVNSMVPTVKDDIMIYLGRDKRKILVTDYDFVVQRFRANCISDNYDNFLQAGIKELHYIPRKSSLIYGVLENGQWFALLFDAVKNKNSIYPFEISGNILDVQPIKSGDETKLLVVTQLPTYQYLLEEKLPQPDQAIMDFMTTQEKQEYTEKILNSEECYLDHSIKRSLVSPSLTVSNLPYVPGEEIEVIADGQYLGTKTVEVDAGTGISYISFDDEISEVVMGYKYDSYAVLKFVSPYNIRKFPKEISVNFINSGYLEVGNTFDSLKSVLNNLVESVSINNERILMNGNYTKTLDKQAFETPYVIVRSDKGLPFIITGIDYKVDTSNYQGGV